MIRLAWMLLLASVAFAGPESSAVKVTQTHDGWVDSGSGTVVHATATKSLVLTNRHVIPNGEGVIRVHLPDRSIRAEWLGADDIGDLALLAVAEKLPAVEVATAEPVAGTLLRQWGHPHGGPAKPKSGPAIGRDGSRVATTGAEVFYVGFTPEHGDSGAGLFDPDGRLVAVNWGGAGRPSECCVALHDVRRFLGKFAK